MRRLLSLITVLTFTALMTASCAYADDAVPPSYAEVTFSKSDLNTAWDEDDAVLIQLDGESAEIAGVGATAENGVVTISSPGDYVLSGSFNGQIIVEINKEEKAHLILNGVEITSSGTPAIEVRSADKVTLTLLKDTVNTLTDSGAYTLADGEDEPNACLFSKEDLSINGEGALTIIGNYRFGVNCKDDLRISDGVIDVTAVEDGIRGRDSLAVAGGVLTVQSGEDGLKSNNDEEDGKGLIAVSGGVLAITAGNDGMQAAQRLQITGGDITIKCGEGAGDVSSDDYTVSRGGRDFWGNWDMNGGSDTVSMKGLKSDGDLIVAGGVISVDAEDDALHAAKDISITGGEMRLKSGDDGVHSDTALNISGGVITVEKSYEGIEGTTITVSGGTIAITASDDGVNAAGDGVIETVDTTTATTPITDTPPEPPTDGIPQMPEGDTPPEPPTDGQAPAAPTGRGGKGNFGGQNFGGRGGMMMDANENNVLTITGGSVYVNASGDGLDANGYIYIEGGTIVVDGPSNSGNGALDPGYGIFMNGGVLIAAGAVGMEETPESSSAQPSLYAQVSVNAGDTFAILDESGALVAAYTAKKNHTSVIVSSPNMTLGASYTLSTGGSVDTEADNGLYLAGSYVGGSQIASVTLTDTVTSYGSGGGMTWNNRWGR